MSKVMHNSSGAIMGIGAGMGGGGCPRRTKQCCVPKVRFNESAFKQAPKQKPVPPVRDGRVHRERFDCDSGMCRRF